MPINTKYPLVEVIEAAKVFDRRVTFEYVMLGGVNDQPAHAADLAALARECRAFVNLIPLHPGGSQGFTPTPAAHAGGLENMLAATSRDTVRSRVMTGKPARQLRTAWTEAWDSDDHSMRAALAGAVYGVSFFLQRRMMTEVQKLVPKA